MKQRITYGNIKTLLHFDYPYHLNATVFEPGYGLRDELVSNNQSTIAWSRIIPSSGVGYGDSSKVWMGRGCAEFHSDSEFILGTNLDNLWDLDPLAQYEIEFFINPINYDAVNILKLENFSSNVFNLKFTSEGMLQLQCGAPWNNILLEGSIIIPTANYSHILLRVNNGELSIRVNAILDIAMTIPTNTVLKVSDIYLGGYVGLMDEFCFRYEIRPDFAPPLTQYVGSVNVSEFHGYGDGALGTFETTANFHPNTHSQIIGLQNNGQILTLNPLVERQVGQYGDFEVGDEVMIHVSVPKVGTVCEHIFKYDFARIVEIQDDIITLDREIEAFPASTIMDDYILQLVTIPNYENLIVKHQLLPYAWVNNCGGILALRCSNTLTLMDNSYIIPNLQVTGKYRIDNKYFCHNDILYRGIMSNSAFCFILAHTVSSTNLGKIGGSADATVANTIVPIQSAWGYGGVNVLGYTGSGSTLGHSQNVPPRAAGCGANAVNTANTADDANAVSNRTPFTNPGDSRDTYSYPGIALLLISNNLIGLALASLSTGACSNHASSITGNQNPPPVIVGGTGGAFIATNQFPLALFTAPFNKTVPIRWAWNKLNTAQDVDIKGSIVQSKAQAFDLLAKTYVDSIYLIGAEPANTIRKLLFQVDDDDWSIFDTVTKELVPVATQIPTTESILMEGNLVADVAVLKDIQAFVGHTVRIAAAMSLTDPNQPSPTLKIGILAR